MKKFYSVTLCFLLLSAAASAQDKGRIRFGLQLDGGLYVLAMGGGGLSMTSTGPIFGGIVMMDYCLPKNNELSFGVGLGAHYASAKRTTEGITSISKLTQANVDLYVNALNSNTKRFGVRTGLRFGFPISIKSKIGDQEEQDYMDLCNVMQFGILFNPYFQFGHVTVGLDVGYLFSNLYKKEGTLAAINSPSATIDLTVGYRF